MADIDFKDNSKEILTAMDKALKRGLKAIGMVAEGYAKDLTPVDTGRLRNSISHAETDNATYIGTNVEYAPYIEFGTSKQPAHHMLKKSSTEHTDEYKAFVEESLKNA